MELFEIEERIVKESQTYTPNVYSDIVAAAQAEGLLNASTGGAVGVTAAGSSASGNGAAVKTTAALSFKKILLISASAIAAAAIAVGSITAAVVLNSDDGGLPDTATTENGTQEEIGDNDETGVKGDDETDDGKTDDDGDNDGETKITTYVGLTYRFMHANCPKFDQSPSASEEEFLEISSLISLYNEAFYNATITFSTADSFTLNSYYGSTYSGTVEKSIYDYQIDLNVNDTPIFYTEDDYAYVLFDYKYYGSEEIEYGRMTILVIPEGKTPNDTIYLHFNLEK